MTACRGTPAWTPTSRASRPKFGTAPSRYPPSGAPLRTRTRTRVESPFNLCERRRRQITMTAYWMTRAFWVCPATNRESVRLLLAARTPPEGIETGPPYHLRDCAAPGKRSMRPRDAASRWLTPDASSWSTGPRPAAGSGLAKPRPPRGADRSQTMGPVPCWAKPLDRRPAPVLLPDGPGQERS